MPGIIGKKIGITSVFSAEGKNVPCTVIEAGPCVITQVKTVENDGYEAIQLGFDDKKEKSATKPELGHVKKAKTAPKRVYHEFKTFSGENKLGVVITVERFAENSWIDVTGKSKGKGFQGVVKGGQKANCKHNRLRAPGSIGASSYPSRVFKGMRMAGQTGNATVTIQNLRVLKVIPEKNLLVVRGSLPGAKGSYVIIDQ